MVSFTTPQTYDPDVERRLRLAEMLQQRAMQPLQAQQGMRIEPKISPIQVLAKLGEAYFAGQAQDSAQTAAKAAQEKDRTALADYLTASPRGSSAPPVPFDDDGNASPMVAGESQAEFAKRRQEMARALLMSNNPMNQQVGMQSLQPKPSEIKAFKQDEDLYRVGPNGTMELVRAGERKRNTQTVNGQIIEIPQTGAPQSLMTVPQQVNPASDLLIPGPDGKLVPNAALIGAKSQVAAAGRPSTQVNVNTAAKPMYSEIGGGVGSAINNAFTGAQSAVQTLQNVQQIEEGLAQNPLLGPGANVRVGLLQIGDMLGVNGKDDADRLVATRKVIQALARQELAAAGQMKGQGQITESERKILAGAESGKIESLTASELRQLASALTKSANYRLDLHEANMVRLRNDPNMAGVVPHMEVQRPQPRRRASDRQGGGGSSGVRVVDW